MKRILVKRSPSGLMLLKKREELLHKMIVQSTMTEIALWAKHEMNTENEKRNE